eukprot:2777145-Rhodomonas_salina.7
MMMLQTKACDEAQADYSRAQRRIQELMGQEMSSISGCESAILGTVRLWPNKGARFETQSPNTSNSRRVCTRSARTTFRAVTTIPPSMRTSACRHASTCMTRVSPRAWIRVHRYGFLRSRFISGGLSLPKIGLHLSMLVSACREATGQRLTSEESRIVTPTAISER